MKIILGIFNQKYYDIVKHQKGLCGYFAFLEYLRKKGINFHDEIIDIVYNACKVAQEIHFVIDAVEVPLSEFSETRKELDLVLKNKQFFQKTTFYKLGRITNKYIVRNKYLKPTKIPRYAKTNLSLQLQESTE